MDEDCGTGVFQSEAGSVQMNVSDGCCLLWSKRRRRTGELPPLPSLIRCFLFSMFSLTFSMIRLFSCLLHRFCDSRLSD